MTVFDLICELTHFDPYCSVNLKDKSGDIYPLELKEINWNGDTKYKSSELYITIKKEVED